MITHYPKPLLKLRDYEAYSYYRDRVKNPSDQITNRADFAKIVSTIFQKAADALIENESGVVLEKIGYFAAVRRPYQSLVTIPSYITSKGNKTLYNLHSDRYVYLLKMFPEIHNKNMLRGWMMDYMFYEPFKKRFAKKLKTGHRYKLRLKLVKSLTKNKRVTSF